MQKIIIVFSLFTLIACGPMLPKSHTPIGKFDQNVKGTIDEDMPSYSSEQMVMQNEIINPALKWQHLDLTLNKQFGVSSDQAYKKLKLKQNKTIIVAVIDSGVDYEHEDLKDVMWVNKSEIPDNGIDDDQNGYIDDIHGWNFLGNAQGENLVDETLEETRIYKRLKDKLEAGETLNSSEQDLFYTVSKIVTESFNKYNEQYQTAKADHETVTMYLDILKTKIGLRDVDSRKKIDMIKSKDPIILKMKKELLEIWDKYWRGFPGIVSSIDQSKYYATVGYNINYQGRAQIVADDPSDFSDIQYGNNDVEGPDAGHGTHVAGIIGASRNNGLGINGIAGNVKIMALRAVPNGDERDKDIALAVRYAVDNGAHIINMSFGKKFSPYKAQVDKAFDYAAKRGVILVHAAGNSSQNIDGGINNFPNHYKLNGKGVLLSNTIQNWLEVGASTSRNNYDLIAKFSNYGNEAVTLFAPGKKIYAPTPNDTYSAKSGTSMASPVAAGVLALVMSELPNKSGKDIMAIIKKGLIRPEELKVFTPVAGARTDETMWPLPFENFSNWDGVINAHQALKLLL